MAECLHLAEKGKGRTSPNPLVGALLVVNNTIVARGYHKRFGGPHAEVHCLERYRGDVRNATLYVNLEPCSHYGKTPPCVDLILQRGVKKVVVATRDPNPRVAGKGIARLRNAGVEVIVGVLEADARHINRFFFKHILAKIPYIHVKIAQTRDGFIAKDSNRMHYVSSLASRKLVHRMRTEYDVVLVGAGTIKADNPRLDARLAKGRDPDVVVLDGMLSARGNERVFSSASQRRVFVCTTERACKRNPEKIQRLARKGVELLQFSAKGRRLNLWTLLRQLYRHKVGSIIVEGGREVFEQFVLENYADELSLFVANKYFRTGIRAMNVEAETQMHRIINSNPFVHKRIGSDLLITGHIKRSTH